MKIQPLLPIFLLCLAINTISFVSAQETDLTKLGLIFVDEEKVTEELMTLVAINQDFEIHPHQADLAVTAKIPWLPPGGKRIRLGASRHTYHKKSPSRFRDGLYK